MEIKWIKSANKTIRNIMENEKFYSVYDWIRDYNRLMGTNINIIMLNNGQ